MEVLLTVEAIGCIVKGAEKKEACGRVVLVLSMFCMAIQEGLETILFNLDRIMAIAIYAAILHRQTCSQSFGIS